MFARLVDWHDSWGMKHTLNKMSNHLWYISPELVHLSLFSNIVKSRKKENNEDETMRL